MQSERYRIGREPTLVLFVALAGLAWATSSIAGEPGQVSASQQRLYAQSDTEEYRIECRRYASTAAEYARENRVRDCGFEGPRWHPNSDVHFRWCMRVSRAERAEENNMRDRRMRQCLARGDDTDDRRRRRGGDEEEYRIECQRYASTAAEYARENHVRDCGFDGPRWRRDARFHFRWCMRHTREARFEQERIRDRLMSRCVARGEGRDYERRRGGSGYQSTFHQPRMRGHIVDHCRTWATDCGQPGANQFCRRKGFRRAVDFERFRPGSTYVIGSREVCEGRGCVGFRSVTCAGRR